MSIQNLWARWRAAVYDLDHGRTAAGTNELRSLFNIRSKLPAELLCQIAYSYAVALLMTGQFKQGEKLLRQIRRKKGYGSREYDPVNVATELSFAYIWMGRADEAIKESTQAINQAAERGTPRPIPYCNRGMAWRLSGEIEKALTDFLEGVDLACDQRDVSNGSILAEQIGRTLLILGKLGKARSWANLARRGYMEHAPQHLKTFQDLENSLNSSYVLAQTDGMPNEFRKLDMLLNSLKAAHWGAHLTVFDLDLYRFLSAVSQKKTPVWIRVPLDLSNSGVSQKLFQTLAGDIQAISDHPLYPELIGETRLARHLNIDSRDLPSFEALHDPHVVRANNNVSSVDLVWESPSAWPHGFGAVLSTLSQMYQVARYHLNDRAKEFTASFESETKLDFAGLTGRTWPRAIHARYLGLGEFDSGHMSVPPHLVEELVRGQFKDSDLNISGFHKLNYSMGVAEHLAESGILSIPFDLLHIGGPNPPISLGGIPINEYNLANWPAMQSHSPKPIGAGFILDSYYQTVFFPFEAKAYALYGTKGDLYRDHFVEFRHGLNIVGSVRAKHYSVPIIEVGSLAELRELARRLPQFEGNPCYYRGQTRPYAISRWPEVKQLLYGTEDVVEPSLQGAAPRRILDYNDFHPAFQLLVQDLLCELCLANGGDLEELHDRWFNTSSSVAATWDTAVMALAQHYGIPTPGLDITSSLEVALWFATNKFNKDANGQSRYIKVTQSEWETEREMWPVVYFILPVSNSLKPSIRSIQHLEELGLIALRPKHQHGFFFMGADTIHQNRMAEALVCVVRLQPAEWETGLTFKELFPSPEEDPSYDYILRIKRNYSLGPFSPFVKEIPLYAYND
jgi:tetratricopeptide (TPR) repeat protein